MSNIWNVCKRSYEDCSPDQKQKLRDALTAWSQNSIKELNVSAQQELMGCYYLYASKRLWLESREQEQIWNKINNQNAQALALFIDSSSNLELDSYGERLIDLMKYLVLKANSQGDLIDQIRWWIPSYFKSEGVQKVDLDPDIKERIHGLQSDDDAIQMALLFFATPIEQVSYLANLVLTPEGLRSLLNDDLPAPQNIAFILLFIWELNIQTDALSKKQANQIAQFAVRLAGIHPHLLDSLAPLIDTGLNLTAHVEGGTFKQGLPREIGYGDNVPQRTVEIGWNIEASLYPVTVRQAVKWGFTKSSIFELSPLAPVTHVTLEEAINLCNARSRAEGLNEAVSLDENGSWNWNREANGWRLPAEAEWELIADGMGLGSADRALTKATAHFKESSPSPVGLYYPNRFGIYDLCGNVWELNYGFYIAWSYTKQPHLKDPLDKMGSKPSIRGGSWGEPAEFISTHQRMSMPCDSSAFVGLRMIRSVSKEKLTLEKEDK